MEIKFNSIEFPVEIESIRKEKRKLEIKQYAEEGGFLFTILMDGYNLINFYPNGSFSVNVDDYPGRDYRYDLSDSRNGEMTFKLVPSNKEEK